MASAKTKLVSVAGGGWSVRQDGEIDASVSHREKILSGTMSRCLE